MAFTRNQTFQEAHHVLNALQKVLLPKRAQFFKIILGGGGGGDKSPCHPPWIHHWFCHKGSLISTDMFFNRSVLVKNASNSIQVIIWDTTLNIRSTGCQCRYSRSKPQYKVPFFETFFKFCDNHHMKVGETCLKTLLCRK